MLAVTTDFVLREQQRLSQIVGGPDYVSKAIAKDQENFRKEEEIIKASASSCPIQSAEFLDAQSGNINPTKVFRQVNEKFDDYSTLQAAQCAIDAIIMQPPAGQGLTSQQKIRTFFRDARRIGAESAEGVALLSGVGAANSAIVMKAPKDVRNKGLVHELFVGWRSLNPLRQFIPNFAYIFGGFRCSPPWIDQNKRVQAICSGDKESSHVQYVLYENISPAIDMKKMVSDSSCTITDFLQQYLQMLLALDLAYRRCGFTHYDLHYENVMIRQPTAGTKMPAAIEYQQADGKNYYVRTDNVSGSRVGGGVATGIDYGMSRVFDAECRRSFYGIECGASRKSYGISDRTNWGIYPDRGYPMFDAYKLLCFCMFQMHESGNHTLFSQCEPIYRLFNKDEPTLEAILKQRNTLYHIPYVDEWAKISHYELFSKIIALPQYANIIGKIVSTTRPVSGRVLGCASAGTCNAADATIKIFGMDGSIRPDEPEEFYDLYNQFSKSPEKQGVAVDYFRRIYEQKMVPYVSKYTKLAEKLINGPSIPRMTVQPESIATNKVSHYRTLFSENFFATYRDYVNKSVEIISDINEFRKMSEVLRLIFRVYGDQAGISAIGQNLSYVNARIGEYSANVRSINGDIKWLNKTLSDPQFASIYRGAASVDGKWNWYFDSLSVYLHLLE